MLRKSNIVLMGIVLAGCGLARVAQASQPLAEPVQFNLSINPTQGLSDLVLHYSTQTDSAGLNLTRFSNFPADHISQVSAVADIPGGIANLLPTWTSFSLYSVQVQGFAPTYGICVAINPADYPSAAGQNFNQLFGMNINAAFNDGQTHTEADLINEFLTTGQADANFTAGITNTPAADIPYGGSGILVLYSNGAYGGTMSVSVAPEPASAGMFCAAGLLVLGRRCRRRR
ncbi:MAG: hypothetical protein JWO87_1666 [Phycisphaerales bacterium]|nr:hypothetical protein [Phycisphaerales bacterium]